MRTWLKGGLIGAVVGLIISILIFGYLLFMGGAAILGVIYYGPRITPGAIIAGFIIGALIGAISKKILGGEGSYLSKGWKIGFWVGLIFGLILGTPLIINDPYAWGYYFFPLIIIIIGIIIGAIIGLIIGKIKSRKQVQEVK